MENVSKTQKLVITLLLVLLLVFMGVMSFNSMSRSGKTKVVVEVSPSDASLSLDGEPIRSKTLYLEPGKYTIVASKSGFEKDEQEIKVSGEQYKVYLLPVPVSPDESSNLDENSEIQNERATIASNKASQEGDELRNTSPIITLLPYEDGSGPFTIDYGPSPYGDNEAYLIVSDSSPAGRQRALAWIRSQGYDPADYQIEFDGFINPLVEINPEVQR